MKTFKIFFLTNCLTITSLLGQMNDAAYFPTFQDGNVIYQATEQIDDILTSEAFVDLSSLLDEGIIESKEEELVECHCFGKVTADCHSFGAVGGNYSWPCKTTAHYLDCCGRVKNAFAGLSSADKQNIANCLCSKGLANNTKIKVTAAVATEGYQSCDEIIGTLKQTPAYDVTTCTCPKGWLSNSTNIDGGVTTDGKCKKGICGPWDKSLYPPPQNGTLVGTWGFTWDNGLYAWGTAANGGAAVCNTVHYPAGPCSVTWNY